MAQEMSPQHYAEHVGIPASTVDDWIQGRGAVLFDPRDLREIHGRLKLIAVQAPNGAGLGARPRFIPNPAYKYERKRKSVHEAGRARPVEVVPIEGPGVPGVAHPAPQDVQGDAALGVVGGEGMAEALEVADGEAGARHG
jgi:hypothetical protein